MSFEIGLRNQWREGRQKCLQHLSFHCLGQSSAKLLLCIWMSKHHAWILMEYVDCMFCKNIIQINKLKCWPMPVNDKSEVKLKKWSVCTRKLWLSMWNEDPMWNCLPWVKLDSLWKRMEMLASFRNIFIFEANLCLELKWAAFKWADHVMTLNRKNQQSENETLFLNCQVFCGSQTRLPEGVKCVALRILPTDRPGEF